MSDADIVAEAVARFHRTEHITDGEARVIASQWHGGQSSALCTLATTGGVRYGEVLDEIWGELNRDQESVDRQALEALMAYVFSVGPRGSVAGWSKLWGA